MDLRIVNPNPKYSTATLIPPTTLGYVHLAAEVRPPPRPRPVIGTPRRKAELIGGLKVLARQLEQAEAVEKVTVYSATVMAPPTGYVRQHKDRVRPAGTRQRSAWTTPPCWLRWRISCPTTWS